MRDREAHVALLDYVHVESHIFFLEIEIKIPNIAPFAPKSGMGKALCLSG